MRANTHCWNCDDFSSNEMKIIRKTWRRYEAHITSTLLFSSIRHSITLKSHANRDEISSVEVINSLLRILGPRHQLYIFTRAKTNFLGFFTQPFNSKVLLGSQLRHFYRANKSKCFDEKKTPQTLKFIFGKSSVRPHPYESEQLHP